MPVSNTLQPSSAHRFCMVTLFATEVNDLASV